MAVEVSTVPLLSEKLFNLIVDELMVYPGLENRFRSTMIALKSIFTSIGDVEVEEKRRNSSEITDSLLGEIMTRLTVLEDTIDTFLMKKELRRRRQKSLFKIMYPLLRWTSLKDQMLFSNEMDKFLTYAKNLNEKEEEKEPTPIVGMRSQPIRPNFSLTYLEDDSYIVGLEDKVKEIVDLLSYDYDDTYLQTKCLLSNNCMISVTGKAGSGKTALTKMIYNRVDVKLIFRCRAWVRLEKDFEAREVLVNILTQLGVTKLVEVKNISRENRLQRTLIEILESQACLIVMDDVSTPKDVMEKLLAVGQGYKRLWLGRVILTTRNKDDATNRYGNRIELRSLTDKESWTLFLKKARIPEDRLNDPVLINLKKNILRKCDGLPQAVIILGGLLSTRDVSEWIFGHGNLQEHGNIFQENLLALSFQDLPSQTKSCFLYVGLFPRAFEIPLRRLFHLWITEGLVTPFPGKRHMAAEEYFKELVERNMIEVARVRSDGSPKTCRMPGSLWDEFNPKAVALGLFHEHNNTTNSSTSAQSPKSNVRRLAEYAGINSYPSSDPYIQYLRSYISFNTRKRDLPSQDIGMFLNALVKNRGFGFLVVLDLEGVYKPVLPETLGKFFHLKYVGLRWTFLDSLPMSIGDLPNLETLDVKHTNISVLPRSIWKAKKLRHLYLNENHLDVSIHKPCNGSLINLQTLWGLYICYNSFLVDYLYALVGLRKLGLTFHSTSPLEIANWISKLKMLQSLRLRSCDEFGRPSDLLLGTFQEHEQLTDLYLLGKLPTAIYKHQFPANLKILTLSASRLGEDPMPMLGQLLHLNILRLYGNSYSGKQLICLPEGFPQLRVLKLWLLKNLKKWTVKKGAMPGLRELEIRSCNKLEKVTGLQKVTTLKDIILTNMPEDVVTEVKGIMPNDVFIKVNTWEFAPLRVERGNESDEEEVGRSYSEVIDDESNEEEGGKTEGTNEEEYDNFDFEVNEDEDKDEESRESWDMPINEMEEERSPNPLPAIITKKRTSSVWEVGESSTLFSCSEVSDPEVEPELRSSLPEVDPGQSTLIPASNDKARGLVPSLKQMAAEEFFKKFDDDGHEGGHDFSMGFSAFGGAMESFGIFSVPTECAAILQGLMENHGDFTLGCIFNPTFGNFFLKQLCAVLLDIKNTQLKEITEDKLLGWKSVIKEIGRAGFDVAFILEHVRGIAYALFGLQMDKDVSLVL